MKRKFTLLAVCLTVGFGLFLGFNITDNSPNGSRTNSIDVTTGTTPSPEYDNSAIKYQDDMDGANDTTALKSRGYKIFRANPIGSTAAWFQGNDAVFPSFNGPTTGYTAANFNAVTGANNIDTWLILPKVNTNAGDTLSFVSRAPAASTFPDSIRVMYSANGDSTTGGSWVELGRFKVNTAGTWELRSYVAPAPGANARFAIRYAVVNGGPSGSNSDYIGIDAVTIHGPAGPPPGLCNFVAGSWHPSGTYSNMPAPNYYSASEWLGDTLYVQSVDNGAATTTINRYTFGGSWSAGVPIPVVKAGATLTKCGGKLYLIGGGATVTAGSSDVYEYDPSTGSWTARAPMPASLSGHGAVNWGDSVIFVVGGPWTGSGTNLDVHYFRPASNTWGTISASLPSGQGRRAFAIGLAGGNKIVISGGFNTAFLKTTHVGTIGANASSITWAAGPDIPTGYTGLSRCGGTAYGDWFFLNGGEKGGSPTTDRYGDSTYVFDVNLNSWIYAFGGMPYRRSNHFNQVTSKCINDTVRIFISGGYGSVSGATPGVGTNILDVTGLSVIVGVQHTNTEIPERFTLSQNYPNPFNPTTKIRFDIPKQSFVTLKVYDITGREISTLIGGIRSAGGYIVDFDGSNLASGTYFYRLQAGDFVEVKKMVLLK